jgi:ribosome-associated protein
LSDASTTTDTTRELAVTAARAAAGKLAERIVILDVRELIVITDYFVIVSGASERQVRAIAEDVEHALRDLGAKPVRREGEFETHWILLDFVDIVVHVFADEERDFYDLERLWSDAPRVRWEDEDEVSSG